MHNRRTIRNLLDSNPKAVRRAIIRLFLFQTNDEKSEKKTKRKNNIGFSCSDAKRGTNLAKKFLNGDKLTNDEWNLAREIAKKYSRQLANYANSN